MALPQAALPVRPGRPPDPAKAAVNSVAFSPDGERLAAACGDGTIKVWNCRTGEVVQTLNDNPGFVYSVAFHPGGKHLAAAGADRKVRVWDLTTAKPVFKCAGHAGLDLGTAYVVAFSPDGRRLAAGSDGAVNVWDWRNRQLPPIHTLPGDEKMANSVTVAFSRDGRRLASGGWSGGVRIWDAETGERLRTLSGHHHPVRRWRSARTADAWSRPASTGTDRVGHDDRPTPQDLRGHVGVVLGVAFSPDGFASPRPAEIRRCASGRRRPAGRCSAFAGTPSGPGAWRSAPTAGAWRRRPGCDHPVLGRHAVARERRPGSAHLRRTRR